MLGSLRGSMGDGDKVDDAVKACMFLLYFLHWLNDMTPVSNCLLLSMLTFSSWVPYSVRCFRNLSDRYSYSYSTSTILKSGKILFSELPWLYLIVKRPGESTRHEGDPGGQLLEANLPIDRAVQIGREGRIVTQVTHNNGSASRRR